MGREVQTFVSEVLPRLHSAESAFREGDAEQRLALWSRTRPVSWVGQFGTCVTGPAKVADHFRWVASRFTGVSEFRADLVAVDVSGDTAYTVQFEHFLGTFDGRPDTVMVHRVSRLYCREQEEWRIAHAHGDVAPWAWRPTT